MYNVAVNFDVPILVWIQEHIRSGLLTPVVNVITHLGDAGIFWIVLTLILLVYRKTRKLGFACAISMVIGLLITNVILKNWIARPRPYDDFQMIKLIIETQKDYSVPSGHSCNSFACAWVIFRMAKKRWGVPALILAILISLSRLYVGVHYPTDVIGGMAIGIFSAEAAMPIVRLMRRKIPAFRRLTRVPKKPETKKRAERA